MSPDLSAVPSVLLTGGAGFIGSHLAEALLARGRSVVILDNLNPFYDPEIKRRNLDAVRQSARSSSGKLTFLQGDIRSAADLDRAFAALDRPAFSLFVHLAAMAGVRPSIAEPQLYNDVNVHGTLQLLEACRRHGVSKVVFASSSSVYGNNEKVPFSEEDRVDLPISPYAATKKAGELLCHNYHHLYGFSIVALRFFTVYGPRQRPDLAIHKFARLLAAGEQLPFYGDGSTRRDYTFVTDTLQGVLGAVGLLAHSAPLYDVFNLGESETTTLSELVDLLGRELEVTPRLHRLPMQPGDVLCTFADIQRAKGRLGYAPQVPIADGIKRFVAWFREGTSES